MSDGIDGAMVTDYWFGIKRERDAYREVLRKLLSADGDHMTACDQIMGDTHPCTCGATAARRLLSESSSGPGAK